MSAGASAARRFEVEARRAMAQAPDEPAAEDAGGSSGGHWAKQGRDTSGRFQAYAQRSRASPVTLVSDRRSPAAVDAYAPPMSRSQGEPDRAPPAEVSPQSRQADVDARNNRRLDAWNPLNIVTRGANFAARLPLETLGRGATFSDVARGVDGAIGGRLPDLFKNAAAASDRSADQFIEDNGPIFRALADAGEVSLGALGPSGGGPIVAHGVQGLRHMLGRASARRNVPDAAPVDRQPEPIPERRYGGLTAEQVQARRQFIADRFGEPVAPGSPLPVRVPERIPALEGPDAFASRGPVRVGGGIEDPRVDFVGDFGRPARTEALVRDAMSASPTHALEMKSRARHEQRVRDTGSGPWSAEGAESMAALRGRDGRPLHNRAGLDASADANMTRSVESLPPSLYPRKTGEGDPFIDRVQAIADRYGVSTEQIIDVMKSRGLNFGNSSRPYVGRAGAGEAGGAHPGSYRHLDPQIVDELTGRR